jgi:hypothetical protein
MKANYSFSFGLKFLIAVSVMSISQTSSYAEAAPNRVSAVHERIAENFDESQSSTSSSGFPSGATMRKLCYDSTVPKFRRAIIVNAGYDIQNPGIMDFSRFDSLVGLSSINVYLNQSHTAQLECFRELVTMSVKMSTPTFGELTMTIDENVRLETMYLSDKFENVRINHPYQYSTSGYYLDVLRSEFSMVPKSMIQIPSMPSTLKAQVQVFPAKALEARVSRTDFNDTLGPVEPTYFGFSERGGEGRLAISASILAQFTERFVNGKPCPIISLSETEAEFKSGVTLQEISQRFYDTAIADLGCQQSMK